MASARQNLARTAPTERPLDALNFFLADVRDGLGPYLAVYLLTVRHWNEAEIGLVMSVAGLSGVVGPTPADAPVGAARHKNLLGISPALTVTPAPLPPPFVTRLW